jgi:hypothetical protein
MVAPSAAMYRDGTDSSSVAAGAGVATATAAEVLCEVTYQFLLIKSPFQKTNLLGKLGVGGLERTDDCNQLRNKQRAEASDKHQHTHGQ